MLKAAELAGDMDVGDGMGDRIIVVVGKSGVFAEEMGRMHHVDFLKDRTTAFGSLNSIF